jgi:ABC-type transport system involved in cytochrome c biogenesis permease subunit
MATDDARTTLEAVSEEPAGDEPGGTGDPLDPERLDSITYRLIAAGFVLLTLTIATGARWARYAAWNRWWGWDPKETSALVAWLVYLVYLHGRRAHWPKRRTAWVALIGALSVLFCYAGVNFLGGLHSYGQPTSRLLSGAADRFHGLDATEALLAKVFLAFYLAGFVAYLIASNFASLVRWRHFLLIGTIPTLAGFVFHEAMLVHRWAVSGLPPFSSGFGYAVSFAWAAVLVLLILERYMRTPVLGAVSMPIVLGILAYGFLGFYDKRISLLQPALQNRFWLHLHIAVAIISYALLMVATATASLYLVKSRRAPRETAPQP